MAFIAKYIVSVFRWFNRSNNNKFDVLLFCSAVLTTYLILLWGFLEALLGCFGITLFFNILSEISLPVIVVIGIFAIIFVSSGLIFHFFVKKFELEAAPEKRFSDELLNQSRVQLLLFSGILFFGIVIFSLVGTIF